MAANVTENLNRFNSVKDRARKLIQMDVKGELSQKAKQARNEGKISVDTNSDGEFTSVSSNIMESSPRRDFSQIPLNSGLNSNSLPREIMESFKKNQINVGSVTQTGGSVLDDLEAMTGKPIAPPRQQITEQHQQPTQQIVPQTNVDYSIIKMIVEDTMKKYTSALKKSLLTENKIAETNNNNIQAIKIGDKFSFLTENGDLYEAKLEFKKNIKKK